MDNQDWAIQRLWQHLTQDTDRRHKNKTNQKKNKTKAQCTAR